MNTNTETYFTENNGYNKFKIIINKTTNENTGLLECNINIYNSTNNLLYSVPSQEIKEIFIGSSPYNSITKFSHGFGKDFIGNSILIYLTNNKYKYIGQDIFTFNSYHKIIAYNSPVGNNFVPYPYGIDIHGNIYLFAEYVVLLNNKIKKELGDNCEDPYNYYYKYSKILPNNTFISNIFPFNTYETYYINNEEFHLTFTTEPNKKYKDGEEHKIINKDGTTLLLAKEDYINLHQNYGTILGFTSFLNKQLLN